MSFVAGEQHTTTAGGSYPGQSAPLGEPSPSSPRPILDTAYVLWDDEAVAKLALRNVEAYRTACNYGERSDIARYEILWRYGGVYVDADMVSVRSLDALTQVRQRPVPRSHRLTATRVRDARAPHRTEGMLLFRGLLEHRLRRVQQRCPRLLPGPPAAAEHDATNTSGLSGASAGTGRREWDQLVSSAT